MKLVVGEKNKRFREFRTPFPLQKASQHVRVLHAMAQLVLNIEKIVSHRSPWAPVSHHKNSLITRYVRSVRSPSQIMALPLNIVHL